MKIQFSAPEAKRWVTTLLEKNPTLERTASAIVGAVLRARPAPRCA